MQRSARVYSQLTLITQQLRRSASARLDRLGITSQEAVYNLHISRAHVNDVANLFARKAGCSVISFLKRAPLRRMMAVSAACSARMFVKYLHKQSRVPPARLCLT
jgi:hypothetical protein